MAKEIYGPFTNYPTDYEVSALAGQPSPWSELNLAAQLALVAEADRRSGVRGDYRASTTSMRTIVSANRFGVDPGEALVEGFYYRLEAEAGSATWVFTVTPNGSGQYRMWRVFLRLDRAANFVRLTCRPGPLQNSQTPAPPAPVRDGNVYEIPIARCRQNPGDANLDGAQFADERPFLTSAYPSSGIATVAIPAGATAGTSGYISTGYAELTTPQIMLTPMDGTALVHATLVDIIDTGFFRIAVRKTNDVPVTASTNFFVRYVVFGVS